MESEDDIDSVEKQARIRTHQTFLNDRKENKIMDNLIRDMIENRRRANKRRKVKENLKNKQKRLKDE